MFQFFKEYIILKPSNFEGEGPQTHEQGPHQELYKTYSGDQSFDSQMFKKKIFRKSCGLNKLLTTHRFLTPHSSLLIPHSSVSSRPHSSFIGK